MEKIKINNVEIFQPLGGLAYDTETTYSEDTNRNMRLVLHLTPLGTVCRLTYNAKGMSASDVLQIKKLIGSGAPFTLHYYNPDKGLWVDEPFYVGSGNVVIDSLEPGKESFQMTFSMTGVNPL